MFNRLRFIAMIVLLIICSSVILFSQKSYGSGERKRARELGIIIGTMETGKWNGITDVKGVKVGNVTKISGEGDLTPGSGAVRTGGNRTAGIHCKRKST